MNADLFGLEQQPPRTNSRPEAAAQAGRLRAEQALFLARIRAAGGVAFVARDCRDVLRTLGEAQAP
ncbi:vrr-nuc domain-containing protein [Alicycliphilus sp. B1]|nr:vrr-nuc domain-containing protein [Alicycliphilus sp. B1]